MASKQPKSEPQLPRNPEAEEYLIQCCVAWPDRYESFIDLVDSDDFVDELNQKLWRTFRRQAKTGKIDPVAAGKQHGCVYYLLEIAYDCSSSALASHHADEMKQATKARQTYDACQKGCDAILSGRDPAQVIAVLRMVLDTIDGGAAK